jgi:hypothetical protein
MAVLTRQGEVLARLQCFLRTRPTASPKEAVAERVNNIDTVLWIDFIILSVLRRSPDACTSCSRIEVMQSTE